MVLFFRSPFFYALCLAVPLPALGQFTADTATVGIGKGAPLPKKTPYYLKGERVLEGSPLINLVLSDNIRAYGFGMRATYGTFVRDRLLLSGGLLANYSWLKRVPERFNALTIGPLLGATYHLTNHWKNNFIVGMDVRYDFFSYLPEGRMVLFNDEPTGKRTWHHAPAMGIFGGVMYHPSRQHSISLCYRLEKQFYPEELFPQSSTPLIEQRGFFSYWAKGFDFVYRYTFQRRK